MGHQALKQGQVDPEGLVFGTKRLIGEPYSDGILQELVPKALFAVERDTNGGCVLVVRKRRRLSPETVSAVILEHLIGKKAAADELGREVHDAFVTVPAHFNDVKKNATRNAAISARLRLADQETSGILSEPFAVVLSHFAEDPKKQHSCAPKDSHILVFDLGGGTLDVTLVAREGDTDLAVLGKSGDQHLGGLDFDACLMDLVKSKMLELSMSLETFEQEKDRLLSECTRAKLHLSTWTKYVFDLSGLEMDIPEVTITRKDFFECTRHLVARCTTIVAQLIEELDMTASDVNLVLLQDTEICSLAPLAPRDRTQKTALNKNCLSEK